MTKLKILGAVAILSMMAATQAQAHGIKGRHAAAPRWGATCMTDHDPGACGQPMWLPGAGSDRAGRNNASPPEADAPLWLG